MLQFLCYQRASCHLTVISPLPAAFHSSDIARPVIQHGLPRTILGSVLTLVCLISRCFVSRSYRQSLLLRFADARQYQFATLIQYQSYQTHLTRTGRGVCAKNPSLPLLVIYLSISKTRAPPRLALASSPSFIYQFGIAMDLSRLFI